MTRDRERFQGISIVALAVDDPQVLGSDSFDVGGVNVVEPVKEYHHNLHGWVENKCHEHSAHEAEGVDDELTSCCVHPVWNSFEKNLLDDWSCQGD